MASATAAETQFQATGWLWGMYLPEDDQLRRGTLKLTTGQEIPAILKKKPVTLLKQHLKEEITAELLSSKPMLWTAYPRTSPQLQVTLAWVRTLEEPPAAEQLNRFDIYGLLTHRYDSAAIVEVRFNDQKRFNHKRLRSGYAGFTLKVKGTLPEAPLNRLWHIQAQVVGMELEVMEAQPVAAAPEVDKAAAV